MTVTIKTQATDPNQATNKTYPTDPIDIYTRITHKIISYLEQDILPWRKPWSAEHLEGRIMRPLRWNGTPYSGINTLMLWDAATEYNFTSPYWMTYNQALQMKAQVRKGSKGSLVFYADTLTREEEKEGETEIKTIPFLKGYTVFNANQIEGLPEHYYQTPEIADQNAEKRIEHVENLFAATQANICHGGNKAYYTITHDYIQMPPFEAFASTLDYYATLAHELTHWTRHPTRLDRDFGRKTYGDEGYAKEELVAELGSCFLAADLGLEPDPREEHAAYLQSWLQVLKNDKRFIFSAASYAQKATEYIHHLQKPSIS